MKYLRNYLPPGIVMPFAGSTAPDGWLICDGSDVSITTYAALYAAIGTTYNIQTNPTTGSAWAAPTGFRVPDYRGTFLRGVGTPYQGDAQTLGGWQAHKTRKNGLTVAGGGGHGHGLVCNSMYDENTTAQTGYRGLSYQRHPNPGWGWGVMDAPNIAAYTHTAINATIWAEGVGDHGHTVNDGDIETRPHNKGVNYIIKY